MHISELANRHVERPREIVSVGEHVSVKIIEIDSERRRLSLGIKRVEGEGEVKPDRPYVPPTPVGEEAEAEEAEAEEAEAEEAEEVEEAETEAEAVEAGEPEESAEEQAAETGDDGSVELEGTPTLGLSDDVVPGGCRGRRSRARHEAPAEAEEEAVPTSRLRKPRDRRADGAAARDGAAQDLGATRA